MADGGAENGYVLDLEARLHDYLRRTNSQHHGSERHISWEGVRFTPSTPNYSTGDGQLPTLNPCILDNSEFMCENTSENVQTFQYKVSHKSVFRFRAEFDTCIQAVRTEHGPELLMPLVAPQELQAKTATTMNRFAALSMARYQPATKQPAAAADQRVLYLRSGRNELTEQVGTHEVNAKVSVSPGRKMRVTTEVVEKSFCQSFSQPIRITGKVRVKYYKGNEFSGKDIPITALFDKAKGEIEKIPGDILSVQSGVVVFVVKGSCRCQMTGQMTTKTEDMTSALET